MPESLNLFANFSTNKAKQMQKVNLDESISSKATMVPESRLDMSVKKISKVGDIMISKEMKAGYKVPQLNEEQNNGSTGDTPERV